MRYKLELSQPESTLLELTQLEMSQSEFDHLNHASDCRAQFSLSHAAVSEPMLAN